MIFNILPEKNKHYKLLLSHEENTYIDERQKKEVNDITKIYY